MVSSTKTLDLSHHSEANLHQPLINVDANIDAVRREDLSGNVNDIISQSADSNTFTTNGIIDLLKNEIKDDENIAVKSAILLRLLEVSVALWLVVHMKCLHVCNEPAKFNARK